LPLGASRKRMNGTTCNMPPAAVASARGAYLELAIRGFAECAQACPAWLGRTTSAGESLCYPRMRSGEQVDGERHYLARADFGQ
jgi:hypothetical protein